MKTFISMISAGFLVLGVPTTPGQTAYFHAHSAAVQVVIPHARFLAPPAAGAVLVSGMTADIDIVERVATTTLDISLTNPTGARLEAQLVMPVPDGSALRGFTFQGGGAEPKAELLTREEARRVYDAIVSKTRDPALLEFIGCNLVRSSVFPVEARGVQKVRLVYEHVLPADGDRVDYVLPRTESIDYRVPWAITVRIKSKSPIGAVYSPSHRLDVRRVTDRFVTARMSSAAEIDPGPFRLSYLLQREGLAASLLAYPDPKVGGGYFLLLASVPAAEVKGLTGDHSAPSQKKGMDDSESPQKREVILVLDRSGSMAGDKLEQVKEAALQVVEGLANGEAFNIVIYHEAVESFAPQPVIKNAETIKAARAYIRGIRVHGGTNIHDALVEALRMKPTRGCLPIVLFLTDGRPTVGQTSEKAIREVAARGNPHDRRIFTFGVGVDVNTPLLDRIATETRAVSTYVLPKEDVEVKVAQVFKRLSGPVLAAPTLQVLDSADDRRPAYGRMHDLAPGKLQDLFDGDQMVVLGLYRGEEPLQFALSGDFRGKSRQFKFRFNLDKASTKNAFVPRLWASRKIAVLSEAIRDLGADAALGSAPAIEDPRMKELVQEIVRLSRDFGILTEYTSFLAREGTDLSRPATVLAEAYRNYSERAMNVRSGLGAVNQSINMDQQRQQAYLNGRNGFFDANMNRVESTTVQQVNDLAFYRRGNRWINSDLVEASAPSPDRVVEVGTEEFRKLVRRLTEQNRQGAVSLGGEVLLRVDGKTVLVK